MTTWKYKAKPPYPKNKGIGYYSQPKTILWVEDKNKKIDFKNDEGLFFEVKYKPNGIAVGSIRAYMFIDKVKKGKSPFRFEVDYNEPFTLTITSNIDRDLSGLTASFKSIKIKEPMFRTLR